jgi:small subunit ribosomal protein S16
MVKLRLRRKGKKFHPVYDIVAMHSRNRRDGEYLERLGYYDPNVETSLFKINHERAIYWLNNGAQASDIVRRLLSYDGVLLRRALQFKNKPEAEIDAEVEKHKAVVAARYARRKKLRVERAKRKVREAEEAKRKAEAEAKAAEEAAAKAAEEAAAKAAEEAANAESAPAEA